MPRDNSNLFIANRIRLGLLKRSSTSKYSRNNSDSSKTIQSLLNRVDFFENQSSLFRTLCSSKDTTISLLEKRINLLKERVEILERRCHSKDATIESLIDNSRDHSSYFGSCSDLSDVDNTVNNSSVQLIPNVAIDVLASPPRTLIDNSLSPPSHIASPPPYSSGAPGFNSQMSSSDDVNGITPHYYNVTNGVYMVYSSIGVSGDPSSSLVIRDVPRDVPSSISSSGSDRDELSFNSSNRFYAHYG
jgi:hypothetical protein